MCKLENAQICLKIGFISIYHQSYSRHKNLLCVWMYITLISLPGPVFRKAVKWTVKKNVNVSKNLKLKLDWHMGDTQSFDVCNSTYTKKYSQKIK